MVPRERLKCDGTPRDFQVDSLIHFITSPCELIARGYLFLHEKRRKLNQNRIFIFWRFFCFHFILSISLRYPFSLNLQIHVRTSECNSFELMLTKIGLAKKLGIIWLKLKSALVLFVTSFKLPWSYILDIWLKLNSSFKDKLNLNFIRMC